MFYYMRLAVVSCCVMGLLHAMDEGKLLHLNDIPASEDYENRFEKSMQSDPGIGMPYQTHDDSFSALNQGPFERHVGNGINMGALLTRLSSEDQANIALQTQTLVSLGQTPGEAVRGRRGTPEHHEIINLKTLARVLSDSLAEQKRYNSQQERSSQQTDRMAYAALAIAGVSAVTQIIALALSSSHCS